MATVPKVLFMEQKQIRVLLLECRHQGRAEEACVTQNPRHQLTVQKREKSVLGGGGHAHPRLLPSRELKRPIKARKSKKAQNRLWGAGVGAEGGACGHEDPRPTDSSSDS